MTRRFLLALLVFAVVVLALAGWAVAGSRRLLTPLRALPERRRLAPGRAAGAFG